MINYISNLYDDELRQAHSLKYLPWVGKEYPTLKSNNKILIIGESVYNWGKDEDSRNKVTAELENNECVRGIVECQGLYFINEAQYGKENSRFFRNIEHAILGRDTSNAERENFWKSVCFHEFIQTYLENINTRPNDLEFENGWDTLFKVIDILRPNYILFCGVQASNYFPSPLIEKYNFTSTGIQYHAKIGRIYPRVATITNNENYNAKLVFIRHPSAYFSWQSWNEFINSNILIDKNGWLSELTANKPEQ